jgi:hypothetical protein
MVIGLTRRADEPTKARGIAHMTMTVSDMGTAGQASGQMRLRVAEPMDSKAPRRHVHIFTQTNAQVYTDERQGYQLH